MSSDDYEQRVEDYWWWRNREIDAQLDAEAAARNREIDRLLSGEELKTKYSTGPAGVSSNSSKAHLDSTNASKESKSTPTAEEQFNEHSARSKKSKNTQHQEVLRMLALIVSEYRHARDKYKPQRDVWVLAFDKEMQFDKEMDMIKRELDWLEAILNHVDAYWREIDAHLDAEKTKRDSDH